MIDTFIFDIGNVLLDFDYMKQYRRLFDEETAQAIADATVRSRNWIELDRGVLSYEQVLERIICNAPHLETQIRLAVRELYERVEPFDYAEVLLRELKAKGYKIYILSNYGEKPFADSRARMSFLDWADGQLISYEIRATKPERIVYETLCRRFGICPQQAVFLDDSAKNIAGAAEFGLHTVLFQSREGAMEQLKQLPLAYGI